MSALLVSACVTITIAVCCAVGCVAFVARDVVMRVLADRRDARIANRVDVAAMTALEVRMGELEGNAERWNAAAREVSAMSSRRRA